MKYEPIEPRMTRPGPNEGLDNVTAMLADVIIPIAGVIGLGVVLYACCEVVSWLVR